MLRFILGTAGTGKTTRLVECIGETVSGGGKAVLLVPEQASFEAERLLQRALGPRRALEVDVLSFTRLCNAVFRRFGGLAGVAVSGAGKYLLMSVALGELRDTLQVYRKSAVNPAFLESLVEVCAEFKTAGLPPERLGELAAACEPSPLRDKLTELGAIYAGYQGLLSRGYTDPDDDLLRVDKLLAERDFFGGTSVFVDGFTTFMAAEFALLGRIIAQADDVVFAMTADELHDRQQGTGVFSPVKSAAARLIRHARQAGVSVASPEVLDAPHRYRSPALAHLSRYFLQPAPPAFDADAGEALCLLEAGDIYAEMEQVAAHIAQLARDERFRYNEIAVVARDTGPYRRAIQMMMTRYDVPYFMDAAEEAENFPLISGLLSALDAVRGGFDTESVLAFAKSLLLGLAPEPVAALENYCYSWDVRGAGWLSPFRNNPRGLAEGLGERDAALLRDINAVREAVVEPLRHLSDALRNTDGRRFASGVYDLLLEIGAAEHLTAYAAALPQTQRESFLDLGAQLWDVLMDILDVFGAVLGSAGLQTARACELFRLAVGTAEAAQVPQTLDQVLIGAADRIRPGRVRAVFVVGASEGEFPRQPGGGGLFSDTERLRLRELGAELSPPTLWQSVLERYYAYFALTLPADRLYVSHSRRGPLGRELRPSVIVTQLCALFPSLSPAPPALTTLLGGCKSAFALLSRHYRQDSALTSALLAWSGGGEKEEALARMRRAALRPPHGLADTAAAAALFGRRMRLSPSRVERYYRCPFSYFAADGLALKKRRRVEFTPLESGSVIHHVLQVMVQRHGGKGLAPLGEERLAAEVRDVITLYLSDRVEDMRDLPARFKYLFTRLTGMLSRLLMHLGEEFAQSEFEPVAFELPISRAEGVKPLELVTADGVSVTVEGVVDRVDIMERGGRRYARVVDYKSGAKEFALHDILYGLNMQMLLYLFTIAENGEGALANAIPAGVLYMPVRERYVTTERDADVSPRERGKQWRMNGLLLEDEEVLRGMEPNLAGVFIPARLNKNGALDAKSPLATAAEMGRLAGKVRGMITDMASALGAGRIEAYPVQGAEFDTCAYCDYRAVCGFEEKDAVREIAKIDRAAFFKMLEEEQDV